MTKNILVTGGAGFIGSHLVGALIKDGYRVRVVDNFSTGTRANLDRYLPQVDLVEHDLAEDGVSKVLMEDIDAVFHFAARSDVLASIEAPQANQRSGEISTLKVLEQCARHGVKRLIFAGSASAYGDDPTPLKSESLAPKPLSPYAASKLAGEHYVRAFAKSFGLDGVSLRFFNVFGSHQRPNDSYAGVIPKFVASMREGVNPTIFGDGEQTRDFVHVANVVQASLLALRAQQRLNGDVFNVGSGIATSVNKLVSTLNQLGGTSFVPDHKPRRTGDPRQSCADLSLINASLGYTPAVGLSAGLQEVLASL